MGEKNPTPVGRGIKDSIVAMDQGGSNIVSGGALKQRLQCRTSPIRWLLSEFGVCVTVCSRKREQVFQLVVFSPNPAPARRPLPPSPTHRHDLLKQQVSGRRASPNRSLRLWPRSVQVDVAQYVDASRSRPLVVHSHCDAVRSVAYARYLWSQPSPYQGKLHGRR